MFQFALLPILASSLPAFQSGVYDFYFNSVQRGTASFQIEDDTIRFENAPGFGPSSKGIIVLTDGAPVYAKLQIDGPSPTLNEIQIADGIKKRNGDKFEPIKDSQGMVPYYTTHPYLLKYLLDTYGSKPAGFRNLRALDLGKLSARHLEASFDHEDQSLIAGKYRTIRTWRIDSAPNPESVVFTDQSNRPLEWWIPSSNYEAVLRGYECLRPSYGMQGKVSPVAYSVKTDLGVWTSLRNGMRLKADVYRPDSAGKYPVILQRTCYDRNEFGAADGEYYASRGFVYVTQNVRGRGGSEGPFEPEANEAQDGYDTVKWCGNQPWSNGKVGMVGASYNGLCCWMAAKTKPKWLRTMVSVVPMAGPPDGSPWAGGTHYVGSTLSWYGLLRDRLKVQPFNNDLTMATNTIPLSRADTVGLGHRVESYQEEVRADRFDGYALNRSYRYDLGKIDLPILHLDGWLDTVAVSTRLNYNQMIAMGRKNQKLIWGPWDHFTNRGSHVGDTDPGPQGYFDMHTTLLRWFDRWLKGRDNGIDKAPPVTEFVHGINRWVQANHWPPNSMKPTRWFLQSGKGLTTLVPGHNSPSKYVYDPAKWVADDNLQSSYFFLLGSDASSLSKRSDVISFETKPLKKAIRLDGPVRGHLFAATSAKDTDWAMALMDVRPDGKAISLASGMIRARYRNSYAHPMLLKPGELFAYDIDMWQTGIQIPAGHRLRVDVLSTMFPDRDKNLNTGEPILNAARMVVARQTVYHDKTHASYVELPIVPPLAG